MKELLKSLDAYIEYANANTEHVRKTESDAAFYRKLKAALEAAEAREAREAELQRAADNALSVLVGRFADAVPVRDVAGATMGNIGDLCNYFKQSLRERDELRARVAEFEGVVPVAWLREDGGDAVTAEKRAVMETHQGSPGKRLAELYSVPLVRLPAAPKEEV